MQKKSFWTTPFCLGAPVGEHARRHALRHVVERGAEQVARPRLVEPGLALGQRLVVGDRDLDVGDVGELAEILARLRDDRLVLGVEVGPPPGAHRVALHRHRERVALVVEDRRPCRLYGCDSQKMSHGTSIAAMSVLDLVVAPADPVRPDDVRHRVPAAAVVERVLQLRPDVLLEVRQVGVVERLDQLLGDQVDDVRRREADDHVEGDRARRRASRSPRRRSCTWRSAPCGR